MPTSTKAVITGTAISTAPDGHLDYLIAVAHGGEQWEILGKHTATVLRQREEKLQAFLNLSLAVVAHRLKQCFVLELPEDHSAREPGRLLGAFLELHGAVLGDFLELPDAVVGALLGPASAVVGAAGERSATVLERPGAVVGAALELPDAVPGATLEMRVTKLERFLKASNGDVAHAKACLTKHEAWLSSLPVDLRAAALPELRKGKLYIRGQDRLGREMLIWQVMVP
ncbi:hypothetical protein Ctob_013777 [Chrysochromulina tobinii]|uniref:Uncharacterized protein n=1 Tax=Chrysochromulina tobinii TaxID=1460289 RepID=A0A0M0K3F0_9EUKA|nr:hypothetical protein Ctob_013777 [Chrysochromulina tobinii]|eukprot:KOO33334.1 hypothetical protein Ctob_013777 [Chrysochromulina sp. CCMP291]